MEKIHIVSCSSEVFADRKEAGCLLADELKIFKNKKAVVLGILRGGIIVAREISLKLDAELDIVLSRKIGAPMSPEFALGAVSENGKLFLNEPVTAYTSMNSEYIQQEKKRQMAEIKGRSRLFRKIQPKISIEGRIAIVVDDGVATGATMLAALWSARQEHPKKLIAAIPVGPKDVLEALAKHADNVICLKAPCFFNAVGQFYAHFDQTKDKDVLAILEDMEDSRVRPRNAK